jgi:phosphoribosyl 1,2-cyclic phosphate phosphodiesterase
MRVTVLGCGHSGGTPLVGKGWGNCDPDNPRNRRLRPSVLVEDAGTQILVDTSPDLRQQLLNSGTERLDAVLYTHAHGDHLHGIDDLRAINRAMSRPIDAYADAATWEVISTRFAYVLDHETKGANPYYKPALTVHEIAPGDAFDVGGVHITAFDQDHGYMRTIGYRLGAMAYSTDVVELPESAFRALAGVEVWFIGVLVDEPHPTHAHVDKALDWIGRVGPKRAVLTHLGHELDYDALLERLPEGVVPAYDGMVLEIPIKADTG